MNKLPLTLTLLALALTACNGSGGGGSGTLNLAVSDTPVDAATHVTVAFTGVELQPADSQDMSGSDMNNPPSGSAVEINFSQPKVIDLMQEQDGKSAMLLSGETIPAGNYAWIRLKIDDSQSSITLTDGSVHPLTIPSGDQTGLKLVSGFTVAVGGTTGFTIDFNLRKSVVAANGNYMLKPALRITDTLTVGSIEGAAENTLQIGGIAISDPSCGPAAYIYQGSNVTPVDINPTSTVQPLTTATLQLDSVSGKYTYMVGFLATGSYTVALTCAAKDNPTTADSLSFTTAKDATVTANSTTTVDFP